MTLPCDLQPECSHPSWLKGPLTGSACDGVRVVATPIRLRLATMRLVGSNSTRRPARDVSPGVGGSTTAGILKAFRVWTHEVLSTLTDGELTYLLTTRPETEALTLAPTK